MDRLWDKADNDYDDDHESVVSAMRWACVENYVVLDLFITY